MLKEYNPQLVDKECFIEHYDGKRLEIVIEDMGWVSEAHNVLHVLEMAPKDKNLQERVNGLIAGMQHDLPLGNNADIHLQRLKADLQKTGDYKNLQRYSEVLDDLMQGYRKILKERHEEL